MAIRKGAVGIIFRQNKDNKNRYEFLILKRKFLWKGWEFAKGGIKHGKESEESGVLREIKEETGLENVKIIHKLPQRMEYKHPKRFRLVGISGSSHAVFIVKNLSGDVKLSFEHGDFRWLPYKEAKKTLTYESQKKMLDLAYKHLSSRKP